MIVFSKTIVTCKCLSHEKQTYTCKCLVFSTKTIIHGNVCLLQGNAHTDTSLPISILLYFFAKTHLTEKFVSAQPPIQHAQTLQYDTYDTLAPEDETSQPSKMKTNPCPIKLF